MHTVINALAVYIFLLVVFRVAGRRTVSQLTTFDFVLVLIISETTQNALTHGDGSLTTAFTAILTLVGVDVGLALLKARIRGLDVLLDGLPTIIVRDGQAVDHAMRMTRVELGDVMMAARESHGLTELSEVRYAILETNGRISIVPQRQT